MTPPAMHLKPDEYGSVRDFSGNHGAARHYGLSGKWPARMADGKVSKYAYYFNGGLTEYIQGSPNGTTGLTVPFSFGGWFLKSEHNPVSYPIFISFHLPYIACNGSTVGFRLSYKRASDSTQQNIVGTTVPVLDTWYHVFAVLDSTGCYLYVNGELDASTTDISTDTVNYYFNIGTHEGTPNYRVHGRIDDVRFYDYGLTQAQIQSIMDPGSDDPVRVSLASNGDAILQGIQEEIEWELFASFMADSTTEGGATDRFDSALKGTGLNTAAKLTAAGWTNTMGTFNSGSYTLMPGFCQMFLSGGTNGKTSAVLPSGYDYVMVRWGNWYSGSAYARIKSSYGTATFAILGPSAGESIDSFRYSDYHPDPVTFEFEEAGIVWPGEVWVGKDRTAPTVAKFQNDKYQSINIVLNNRSPNLMPYSGWTLYSQGSDGDFIQNGATTENYRLSYADPWGIPVTTWRCYSDHTSGPDGGWNHNLFTIDNTKTYRYSVWVKKMATDGTFYHGFRNRQSGTNLAAYNRTTGASTTNPYFYYGDPTIGEWRLVVGHVWPAGSGTGSDHSQTGMYSLQGTVLSSLTPGDWVFNASANQALGRTYLYYCTTSVIQYLVYPMFEVCDGNETPLEDLISGRAYHGQGIVPETVYSLGSNVTQQFRDEKLLLTGDVIVK